MSYCTVRQTQLNFVRKNFKACVSLSVQVLTKQCVPGDSGWPSDAYVGGGGFQEFGATKRFLKLLAVCMCVKPSIFEMMISDSTVLVHTYTVMTF